MGNSVSQDTAKKSGRQTHQYTPLPMLPAPSGVLSAASPSQLRRRIKATTSDSSIQIEALQMSKAIIASPPIAKTRPVLSQDDVEALIRDAPLARGLVYAGMYRGTAVSQLLSQCLVASRTAQPLVIKDEKLVRFLQTQPGISSETPNEICAFLVILGYTDSLACFWNDLLHTNPLLLQNAFSAKIQSNPFLHQYSIMDLIVFPMSKPLFPFLLKMYRDVKKSFELSNEETPVLVYMMAPCRARSMAWFVQVLHSEKMIIPRELWSTVLRRDVIPLRPEVGNLDALFEELSHKETNLPRSELLTSHLFRGCVVDILDFILTSPLPHIAGFLPQFTSSSASDAYCTQMGTLLRLVTEDKEDAKSAKVGQLLIQKLMRSPLYWNECMRTIVDSASDSWSLVEVIESIKSGAACRANQLIGCCDVGFLYKKRGFSPKVSVVMHAIVHDIRSGTLKMDVNGPLFTNALKLACARKDLTFLDFVADNIACDDVKVWTMLYRQHSLDPVKRWFHNRMCLDDPVFRMDKRRLAAADIPAPLRASQEQPKLHSPEHSVQTDSSNDTGDDSEIDLEFVEAVTTDIACCTASSA